jgi:hypothetical protein
MDYGSAFVYMFSSKDWPKKFVIAVAMSLIPWLGLIVVTGYALDVLRNLNQGAPDPLPDWTGDDFARWLGRGLGLTVTTLTFLLPAIIVMVAIWFCGAFGIAAVGGDSEGLSAALWLCLCCIFLIMYFVAGLGAFVVYARYASTDRLDVGLDYAKTLQLVGENIGPLLIIVISTLILGVAGVILGFLTLGILFLILPAYYSLVVAYFGAQLSRLPGFTD